MIAPVRGRSTFRALAQAPVGRHGGVRARCVVSPSGVVSPEGPVDAHRRSPRDRSPSNGSPSNVAYAIGRRHGSAVKRNRIRRRLRAAVRELDRRGTVLRPGISYLLASGPEASTCSFAELLRWVEGALQQAGARAVAKAVPPVGTGAPLPSSASEADRPARILPR